MPINPLSTVNVVSQVIQVLTPLSHMYKFFNQISLKRKTNITKYMREKYHENVMQFTVENLFLLLQQYFYLFSVIQYRKDNFPKNHGRWKISTIFHYDLTIKTYTCHIKKKFK